MNPLFARNRISDYLDDDLSPTEKIQFEEALHQSEALQKQVEEMRQSISLFKQHGPSEAPMDLMSSIMDRLDEPIQVQDLEPAQAQRTHRYIWPSLAVAAACLILFIPEAPKAPTQVNMGSILEVTAPNELELPVNMPSAYDLLAPQTAQPKTQPPTQVPASPTPKASKSVEKASKPTKLPTVTFIPETPYVPEWESDNKTIELQHNQSEFYAIGFAAPNVLFVLEALAERYSGTLLNSSKSDLEPYTLNNELNFARVHIRVPLQHWSAADESLRHLGADFRHPMVMDGDDHVLLTVEVTFNP